MLKRLFSLVIVATLIGTIGCASSPPAGTGHDAAGLSSGGLVGAWLASASRPGGEGVVLLTFTSDGTFFRSGDTHPTLSVAHGSWVRVGPGEFEATYIALRFDENKKLIGSQKTRIRLNQGPGPETFTGLAKVSVLDLTGKEERTSETRLQGKRIRVEPF